MLLHTFVCIAALMTAMASTIARAEVQIIKSPFDTDACSLIPLATITAFIGREAMVYEKGVDNHLRHLRHDPKRNFTTCHWNYVHQTKDFMSGSFPIKIKAYDSKYFKKPSGAEDVAMGDGGYFHRAYLTPTLTVKKGNIAIEVRLDKKVAMKVAELFLSNMEKATSYDTNRDNTGILGIKPLDPCTLVKEAEVKEVFKGTKSVLLLNKTQYRIRGSKHNENKKISCKWLADSLEGKRLFATLGLEKYSKVQKTEKGFKKGPVIGDKHAMIHTTGNGNVNRIIAYTNGIEVELKTLSSDTEGLLKEDQAIRLAQDIVLALKP